jgi:hypothetical protein
MNTNTNECVYYWVGGSEAGQWREAAPNRWTPEAERPIDAFERAIQRQGYVTVRGSTLIGPPDGPPSRERLAAAVAL